MKKTFKRQFILFAVITVMMMLALAMPAFAEDVCPGATDGTHSAKYVTEKVCEPTCTQMGYTTLYCTVCEKDIVDPYDFTEKKGHDFEVSYVYSEKLGCYTRVLTCKREDVPCVRSGKDPVDGITKLFADNVAKICVDENDKALKYYRVDYVNPWEPLDENAEGHKDAHLAKYYVENSRTTWVLNCNYSDSIPSDPDFYVTKTYTSGKKETVDGTLEAPENEYINEDGDLNLYFREGTAIPKYDGKTPSRCKDLDYGKYDFTEWSVEEAVEGVVVRYARFTPKGINVTGTFYDYNGDKTLTSVESVRYGEKVSYGDLVTPYKGNDEKYNYEFVGWSVNKNEPADGDVFGLKESVKLYYDTSFYAIYDVIPNKYELTFKNKSGKDLGYNGDVTYGMSLADIVRVFDEENDLFVPRDKQYIYEREVDYWEIESVNGNKTVNQTLVKTHGFNPKKSVLVTIENGTTKEHFFNNGDKITLIPKYKSYPFSYKFNIRIKPAFFRSEDVFEVEGIRKSDLLDDFNIMVTDHYGKYVTDGKPNANGEFSFNASYSKTLKITASLSSGKYYGEHVLNLEACNSVADIEAIAKEGIEILPKVTQDWLDGLKGCGCICHSIISPIVIRIYNLIYKIFGKEFICCDDLFIVHGEVLAYGRK